LIDGDRLMAHRLFQALLGRAAVPDGAPDEAESVGMIAELSARLPDDAPDALRADADSARLLKGRERAAGLAAWFCRVEDVLASRAQDPEAFRATFREQAARHWPRLAALDEMAIAFSPPAQLQITLCRFFLREASQRALDLLGAAGGGKLVELGQWLDAGLDAGTPSPFPLAVDGVAPAPDPLALAAACSRGLYAWLDHSLGRRAETIYENAYQRTARQFGAADAFSVVIGLMPDKLITADKLSLLRRGQIEQVLREKIALLERAKVDIELAKERAEAALIELKAAQQNLIHAEKMASLGQLTAGIAHEIKNPLNFVNNFASLSVELLGELREALGPAIAALDEDRRGDVDEVNRLLTSNLEKIAEHGKRADGIVKSMLAHSRGGSSEPQSTNLNALVEEALNLAYHGARAQDPTFNVALERAYDTGVAPIELVPQDITRVFLNLFTNGFYATNKRRREANDPLFAPVLTVTTRELGDAVEVKVRDNGTGIPADLRDKLFLPFFTTKPTGEGTGLGLSISYDVVTQQHGGVITVDSRLGDFTEFTVRLPRRPRVGKAAASAAAGVEP
jgi:signal transduction histidine kinase